MAEKKEKELKKETTKAPKKDTKTAVKKESKTTKVVKETKTSKPAPKKESKKEVKKSDKTEKVVKEVKDKKEKKEVKKVIEARAILKYERISPSKVIIVANLIRGKEIEEALNILKFTSKAASPILIKLLNSAIANAENNHSMDRNKLYISEVFVNAGPILKRMRPRARGSAFRINKRTSHIEIVLKERE